MEHLNLLLNAVFGAIMSPFRGLNHWYGMIVVSLFSAVVLLAIFKFTSNSKAIRRNKNRAVARLLELLLFKDDIVVNLGAMWRTILANAGYMGAMIRPLLFGIVPFALILVQVSVWFSHRPLRTGESTVIKATFAGDAGTALPEITAQGSSGVRVDTSSVRIPARREVAWRLSALSDGQHSVDLLINGAREVKTIATGNITCPVSPVRAGTGFLDQLINPAESPLPAAGPLARIEVDYPASDFALAGHSCHWLLVYLVLTMAMAWAMKRPFGVEI